MPRRPLRHQEVKPALVHGGALEGVGVQGLGGQLGVELLQVVGLDGGIVNVPRLQKCVGGPVGTVVLLLVHLAPDAHHLGALLGAPDAAQPLGFAHQHLPPGGAEGEGLVLSGAFRRGLGHIGGLGLPGLGGAGHQRKGHALHREHRQKQDEQHQRRPADPPAHRRGRGPELRVLIVLGLRLFLRLGHKGLRRGLVVAPAMRADAIVHRGVIAQPAVGTKNLHRRILPFCSAPSTKGRFFYYIARTAAFQSFTRASSTARSAVSGASPRSTRTAR